MRVTRDAERWFDVAVPFWRGLDAIRVRAVRSVKGCYEPLYYPVGRVVLGGDAGQNDGDVPVPPEQHELRARERRMV